MFHVVAMTGNLVEHAGNEPEYTVRNFERTTYESKRTVIIMSRILNNPQSTVSGKTCAVQS